MVVSSPHEVDGAVPSGSRLLEAITESGEVNEIFVISSPPPNYRDALRYLARQGKVFKPEDLGPMPPAYSELASEVSNTSGRTCSTASSHRESVGSTQREPSPSSQELPLLDGIDGSDRSPDGSTNNDSEDDNDFDATPPTTRL